MNFFGPIVPDICQHCACGWGGFFASIQNLLTLGVSLSIIFAALLIAYAGFLLVVNPASPGNIEKAKEVALNALIGMVIILGAWLIVNTVMNALYNGTFGPWNSILTGKPADCLTFSAAPTPSAASGGGLSGAPSGSNDCPGALICSNGQCARDPNLDQGSGGPDADCTPENSNCQSPLTCDATDKCSDPSAPAPAIPSSCTVAVAAAGGSCSVQTSGPCAASNFTAFGGTTQQNQASAICNHETANGALTTSSVDLAEPSGQSVSFGLFQMNISANSIGSLACPSAFACPNGASPCAYTASNHNLNITNQSLYAQCKSAALGTAGITAAAALFQRQGLSPWLADTRACPNISSGT